MNQPPAKSEEVKPSADPKVTADAFKEELKKPDPKFEAMLAESRKSYQRKTMQILYP